MNTSNHVSIKGRTGKPLTIYLTDEQFLQLEDVAKERRVAKSALVRFALEKLIDDMDNGQFKLPLGITK